MSGNYDVAALSGSRKNIESGAGSGGGCIAYHSLQDGNIFDADPRRKHVDLSGVSAFCAQQTQLS